MFIFQMRSWVYNFHYTACCLKSYLLKLMKSLEFFSLVTLIWFVTMTQKTMTACRNPSLVSNQCVETFCLNFSNIFMIYLIKFNGANFMIKFLWKAITYLFCTESEKKCVKSEVDRDIFSFHLNLQCFYRVIMLAPN